MTLLTVIANVCRRVGEPVPNVVYTATDPTVTQLLSLANEEGTELMKMGDWRALRKEKTFTTLAQETQTAMVPTDLGYWIDMTAWNRSARRPLYGPVSSETWQAWKALSTFPFLDVIYFRGADILAGPPPPAGQTWAFEYISNLWCQSSGGTGQSEWLADTDTGVLSERLMTLGILWRYKQARGLAFDDDYQLYELQVREALSQDSPRSTHSFGEPDTRGRMRPGIVVPLLSWDV